MATIKNLLIRLGVIADDVDGPVDRTTRSLERVARQADRTESNLGHLNLKFDGLGSAATAVTGRIASFTGSLVSAGVSLVTGAAKLAALASALSLAASSAVSLAAALAPAAGAVAALPAAAVLGAAAMITLKVALVGVGDAFKAALGDDPKKFEEALAGLSPAAQSVARELRGLKPAFDQLKNSVQDSLFAPLQGQLTGVVAVLGGPLRAGMSALAAQFGRLAAEGLKFGQSSAAVDLVRGAFATLKSEIGGLESGTLQRLMQAIATFASSTLPAFQGLGRSVNGVAERFTDFLNRASASGQGLEWVQNAFAVFKQLGSVLADVGGIVAAVFRAIQAAGGGALGVIGQLLDGVHAFLDSAEGQEALLAIFKGLGAIGGALLPVIVSLAGALAGLAPTIAQLAQLIGPILTSAVQALAPALQALGPGVIAVFTNLGIAVRTLADSGALTLIAQAIADILIALAPLLPALADILVPVLQGIALLATNVVAPALSTLVGWIQQAVDWIMNAAVNDDHPLARFATFVSGTLGPTVQKVWDELSTAFTSIVTWVQANRSTFEEWQTKIQEIFVIAQEIWTTVSDLIGKVFADISLWVQANGDKFGEWGTRLVSIFHSVAEIVSGVWQFISIAWDQFGAPLLDRISDIFGGILRVIDGVMTTIKGIINVVMGLITGDWDRAWEGVKQVFQGVWDVIVGVFQTVVGALRTQFLVIEKFIGDTWPTIWNGVKHVFTTVWDAITGFISGKINDVKRFIGQLAEIPGQVAGWFGRVRQSIVDRLNEAVAAVQGIPGRIVGALGNMGNLLYNAGRDLVIGFWNGLVSMWNWLVENVQRLFGGLADWAKSILGISSPSKVFAEIGKQIPAGMAQGISRAAGMVEGAVAGLATTATVAMGGMAVAPAYAGATPVGGGGAGAVYQITVNVPVSANPADVGTAIVEAIGEHERRAGAGWRS